MAWKEGGRDHHVLRGNKPKVDRRRSSPSSRQAPSSPQTPTDNRINHECVTKPRRSPSSLCTARVIADRNSPKVPDCPWKVTMSRPVGQQEEHHQADDQGFQPSCFSHTLSCISVPFAGKGPREFRSSRQTRCRPLIHSEASALRGDDTRKEGWVKREPRHSIVTWILRSLPKIETYSSDSAFARGRYSEGVTRQRSVALVVS